jgi:ABC-type dipeptide/oligopeptide/nickel transport system ATPase component
MNEVLLRVENLKTYFRTVEGLAHAVDGVSFKIRSNEIFALVGESGCGMSVTALSIIQLVPQPAGLLREARSIIGDKRLLTFRRSASGKFGAMRLQ